MPDRSTPPGWPRLMAEPRAAAYLDMSTGCFRQHVRPHVPPIEISPGRIGYDRRRLDAWVDALAGDAPPSPPEDEWDNLLAGHNAALPS